MYRTLVVFVHLTALVPAAIWLFLPKRKEILFPFSIAGFVALACFLIALSNYEWVGRWDLLAEKFLIAIAPKPIVVAWGTIVSPDFYLFCVWALAYVAGLQLTFMFHKTRSAVDAS